MNADGSSWNAGRVLRIGLRVFLLVATIVAVGLMPWLTCGAGSDYALKQLRECPLAAEKLGDGIHLAYGIACGSSTTGGATESSDWQVPVSGSRARGTYSYTYHAVGNSVMFSGSLAVDDQVIDIGLCNPGNKDRAARDMDAKVPLSKFAATIEESSLSPVRIENTGMVGSFASFDPVANLLWATDVARHWENDAALIAIDVYGLRRDGVLDLSASTSYRAEYKFVSLAREQRRKKELEVSEKRINPALKIVVRSETVSVLADDLRPSDIPPPPSFGCPLARAIELSREGDGGLAERPTYSATAEYNRSNRHWEWRVLGTETYTSRRIAVDSSCELFR